MTTKFEYLVSVIIPVYNAKKYLRKAINSLRKQTLPQRKIEILLVDDGSTDGSAELCDQYSSKFDNIQVFHQLNAGVSAARNKGIREAKGKYFAFLDADDWLAKETLKNLCDFFDSQYCEFDVLGYRTLFVDPNGRKTPHARDNLISDSGIIPCDNESYITLTRLTVLVKNLEEENVLFPEKLHFHEDEDYLIRILSRKRCFGYLKNAVYYYRRGTGGVTDKASDPGSIFAPSMEMYRTWEKCYKDTKDMDVYVQNCLLNDFAWKLRENKLLPAHLNGKDYTDGVKQIQALLSDIDEERIMTCPALDFRDRFFLMVLKIADKKQEARNKTNYLFLTGWSVKQRKYTVIGMLPEEFKSDEDRTLRYVCEEGEVPIRLRNFRWNEKLFPVLPKTYTGFEVEVPDMIKQRGSFALTEKGMERELKLCYGPDFAPPGRRRERLSAKITFLQLITKIMGSLGAEVWLYHGCRSLFENEKSNQDGIRRYYVLKQTESTSDFPGALQYRSKEHRLLFLRAKRIVLSEPLDQYIPWYERTYLQLQTPKDRVLTLAAENT